MHLDHVALWVSDLETSLAFYETGLGLERQDAWTEDGVEHASVGTDAGTLQLRHDPDRTTPVAPTRADVDHVAFALDDRATVDETFTRVVDRPDCSIVADPTVTDRADAYAALVADPDDYTVELVAPL